MTYERALAAVEAATEQYAYALDPTGWYLFILDKADDQFPEPVAYDLMLDEYRDAYDIPDRARRNTGWWLSATKPENAIERWMAVKPPDIADMLAEQHAKEAQ